MNKQRVIATAVACLLLLGGCGAEPDPNLPAQAEAGKRTALKSTDEAVEEAGAGLPGSHYRDLLQGMEPLGFDAPDMLDREDGTGTSALATYYDKETGTTFTYFYLYDSETGAVIQAIYEVSAQEARNKENFAPLAEYYLKYGASLPYQGADPPAVQKWVGQELPLAISQPQISRMTMEIATFLLESTFDEEGGQRVSVKLTISKR